MRRGLAALTLAVTALAVVGCTPQSAIVHPEPRSMKTETIAPAKEEIDKLPANKKPEHCKGYVALTVDDGPTVLTPSVVNVLRRYEIPATFFNVGAQEQGFPDQARSLADHKTIEVGNHTMTHADLLTLSPKQAMKEITDASAVHKKLGLDRERLWRPPFGSSTPELRRAIEVNPKTQMMEVLWTVDSKDYETPEPIKVFEQSKGMKDGGILLMHDGKLQTILALPSIIAYYQDQGMCWGTIGRSAQDVPSDVGLPMAAKAVEAPKL